MRKPINNRGYIDSLLHDIEVQKNYQEKELLPKGKKWYQYIFCC